MLNGGEWKSAADHKLPSQGAEKPRYLSKRDAVMPWPHPFQVQGDDLFFYGIRSVNKFDGAAHITGYAGKTLVSFSCVRYRAQTVEKSFIITV